MGDGPAVWNLEVRRWVSSGAREASFDSAGRRSYQGDVLSLPLP